MEGPGLYEPVEGTMKRYITCPNRGTLAEIECDQSAEDGHIIGVRRCSLVGTNEWVDCDSLCIKLLNKRELAQQSPSPSE